MCALNLSPRLTGFLLFAIAHAENNQDLFLKPMQQVKNTKGITLIIYSIMLVAFIPAQDCFYICYGF